MRFKERLKELRSEFGLTQEQLADKLDIPASSIRRLESEGDSLPRKERLGMIADYFKCSVDYLVGRTNDRNLVMSEEARRFVDNLELSDEEFIKRSILTLDGIPLTEEQVRKFRAYVRVERAASDETDK